MTDRETAKDIVNEAMQTRSALTDLDHAFQEEIDEIVLTAARERRPLSDDGKARRKALRADQVEIQDAFKALAFVTLPRLDASADVAELKNKLDSVKDELDDDLKRLKNIARYANIAAKVADGLTQLAIKVASAVV